MFNDLDPKLPKKKIVHFIQSLEIGGMENGVVNLVNNMDSSKFEFCIFCYNREGALKKRLNSNVNVICLNAKGGINLFAPLKVMSIIRRIKPDIVHTHGWGSGSLYGIIGARLAGVPIVINGEHGSLYVDKKIRIIAQKTLSLFTDCIVTVSNDLKNDLVHYAGINPKKIFSIINGVDTVKFKPDSAKGAEKRKSLGLVSEDFIVGSVGRLVAIKDYSSLINAAKVVSSESSNIKFILIGDGELRQNLQDLVRSLQLDKNFIFLGQREDVSELLNIFDVFVLPSLDEGLSNVILEAMACGKPVIATDVGNPEIVEPNKSGILVPVKNPEKIADEIIKLAKNKELVKRLGIEARNSVVEKFSLNTMVSNYEKIYEACFAKISDWG